MDSGTATLRDKQPPAMFAAWREAWRNLADNPLAQYMLLAEQRRQRRGKARRIMSYVLLALCLATLWSIMLTGILYTNQFDWQTIAVYSYAYFGVLFVIWLAESIFNVVRDALQVLAPPTKLSASLALDDTLAVSGLKDEDILLGILRILMPRLWFCSLVGSVLTWGVVMIILTEGLTIWNADIERMLVLLPLAMGLTALSSMLGALAFVLFYLTSSRTQHVMALSGAAVVAVLMQIAWIFIGPVGAFCETMLINDVEHISILQANELMLAGFAVCITLICLAALRGRYIGAMRVVNAVIGPWLFPLLLVLAFLAWMAVMEFNGLYGVEEEFGCLALGFGKGWCAILPLNTSALHSSLFMGVLDQEARSYWPILALPVELALRVLLVAILAWSARDALRRRRTEGARSRG